MGRAMPHSRWESIRAAFACAPLAEDGQVDLRWGEIDPLVEAFNSNMERFAPSSMLCVDESVVRWYGAGGDGHTVGVPHYVAMDRKVDAGVEVNVVADGTTNIVLRLEMEKSEGERDVGEEVRDLSAGAQLTLRLTKPYWGSQRTVVGDARFASVETAEELLRRGLRFIGAVKQATAGFPMEELQRGVMVGRGVHRGLVTQWETWQIGAVVWTDRHRMTFVFTTGDLSPGSPAERPRLQRTPEGSRRVVVTVPRPKVVEQYYAAAAAVDRNNRHRQDDLGLERKVETKVWSTRIHLALLGIATTNAW